MTLETLFAVSTYCAIVGWVLLVLFPRHVWLTDRFAPFVLPVLLALAYVALMAVAWPERQGGYGDLAAVDTLFGDRRILLAGWIHYLAFDLFVGAWQARDARRIGLPGWILVPGLALTFLAGPLGLLFYVVSRRLLRGPFDREVDHGV